MEYRILLKREAAKYLASLDKPTRARIKKALEGLSKIPPEGDIVPMKGMEGWFRRRVGFLKSLAHLTPFLHTKGYATPPLN